MQLKLSAHLNTAIELVYNTCGFNCTHFIVHNESIAYEACSFKINGKAVEYRTAKITPTKTGQFVSIWKRNEAGQTAPLGNEDDVDFIIITAKNATRTGQFVFPKTVLLEKGILAKNGAGGKRGIRVYPPWDIASNKQAINTQNWQLNYFLPFVKTATNFELAKKLFI